MLLFVFFSLLFSSVLTCPKIPEIQDGAIVESTDYAGAIIDYSGQGIEPGHLVRYRCNPGFQMFPRHHDMLICLESGWTSLPKCVPTEDLPACGETPNVPNADARQSYNLLYIGDTVYYHCQRGYEFLSDVVTSISCTLRAEWSEHPQCVRKGRRYQLPTVIERVRRQATPSRPPSSATTPRTTSITTPGSTPTTPVRSTPAPIPITTPRSSFSNTTTFRNKTLDSNFTLQNGTNNATNDTKAAVADDDDDKAHRYLIWGIVVSVFCGVELIIIIILLIILCIIRYGQRCKKLGEEGGDQSTIAKCFCYCCSKLSWKGESEEGKSTGCFCSTTDEPTVEFEENETCCANNNACCWQQRQHRKNQVDSYEKLPPLSICSARSRETGQEKLRPQSVASTVIEENLARERTESVMTTARSMDIVTPQPTQPQFVVTTTSDFTQTIATETRQRAAQTDEVKTKTTAMQTVKEEPPPPPPAPPRPPTPEPPKLETVVQVKQPPPTARSIDVETIDEEDEETIEHHHHHHHRHRSPSREKRPSLLEPRLGMYLVPHGAHGSARTAAMRQLAISKAASFSRRMSQAAGRSEKRVRRCRRHRRLVAVMVSPRDPPIPMFKTLYNRTGHTRYQVDSQIDLNQWHRNYLLTGKRPKKTSRKTRIKGILAYVNQNIPR